MLALSLAQRLGKRGQRRLYSNQPIPSCFWPLRATVESRNCWGTLVVIEGLVKCPRGVSKTEGLSGVQLGEGASLARLAPS